MPASEKINALVLDTFPIIVESITAYLKKKETINNVFHATSMQEALAILANNNIGFISLDIKQNKFNGLEFIKKVRENQFKGSILVISSYGYEMYSDSAKKLGANGYISKEESTTLINDAMSNVLRGYTLFKQSTSIKKDVDLSNREIIVLNYLLRGYSNKQISELLSLSAKTISTYKSRILEKHNATSLIDLLKVSDAIKQQL
ncbi:MULTISPECIES: response regulator transcription factor [Aliivibrio]|uniref:DNA-binding response regulator n=2 Tax=Aliivibrio logei TaxID=688 RepID=A0A1B9NWQ3_ALILO|nr:MULTISPECIES: response regulator transcription factor [Aliivibrio]MBB1315750.1 response regulator transcription factor [Aliivibrio sp. SR45-2]OCH19636.1 hypothetical protein A6E04_16565 [Aliivibrio logei]OEF18920.1 hypothetical protein A1Q5_05315 [Aliivibrio logei 5S-186]